jgi:hypothetical protein
MSLCFIHITISECETIEFCLFFDSIELLGQSKCFVAIDDKSLHRDGLLTLRICTDEDMLSTIIITFGIFVESCQGQRKRICHLFIIRHHDITIAVNAIGSETRQW